jgi:RHS repeat-associated protein
VHFDYKFTGKERDAESGLDNFGARYMGSTMGRFMSPDWSEEPDTVPYAEFENPQTLNLYSYGRNSPLVYNACSLIFASAKFMFWVWNQPFSEQF